MAKQLCPSVNTHFGQNQLLHLQQKCLNPGLPDSQASPLHLDLLVFFLVGRSTGMIGVTRWLSQYLESQVKGGSEQKRVGQQ